MSSWTPMQLADVVALRRGHDLPSSRRVAGNVPVIGSGGFNGWHNEAKATGPGVVIGRATNLGVPNWCSGEYWPLNTTLYVTDFKGNDPKFVFHLFETLDLTGYDSGSVQPMLNRNYIARVPVVMPPLDEQRRIAGVLGALDDLIDVNRGLIRDLETLVQTIFRRTLAAMPPGMPRRSLASTVEVISGGTPKTTEPDYWGGPIPWFSVVDTPPAHELWVLTTEKSITQRGLDQSPARIAPVGSTILTARGTVGNTALVGVPMAFNQSCYALKCASGGKGYFNIYRVRSALEELNRVSHGSVFSTITRASLDAVLVPDVADDAVRRFDDEVEPLMLQIRALIEESHQLASTRDELLPLLMSGRVRVGDVAA